jgi:hypothetical protein
MRFSRAHPHISLADKPGFVTLVIAGLGVIYFFVLYLVAG